MVITKKREMKLFHLMILNIAPLSTFDEVVASIWMKDNIILFISNFLLFATLLKTALSCSNIKDHKNTCSLGNT